VLSKGIKYNLPLRRVVLAAIRGDQISSRKSSGEGVEVTQRQLMEA
jgi:hypothetical protein